MPIQKKTVLNLLLFAFVLSFFVTPIGYYGKVLLNRLFARTPNVIEVAKRTKITDYDWRLKNANWDFFNFEKSKGKVVFISFWASWRLPSDAELKGIVKLYKQYGNRVDFYFISNEERPPVEEFMKKNKYDFPLTYLIIGDKMPITPAEFPPETYLIAKDGSIVIHKIGIAKWNRKKIHTVIDKLLAE